MAQLTLDGHTLGDRHRHFNELVRQALATNAKPPKINLQDSDVDNLIKIDVAAKQKNLEYILDVMKCSDMLYAFRAIKKSTWLYTDKEYEHIIEPEYLYSELFPLMNPKASCKMMLEIRLHLKDEERVERFYRFLKARDFATAIRWLPNCSVECIENFVANNVNLVTPSLLKRLCEKSISILEVYIRKQLSWKRDNLAATAYLIQSHPERFLDLLLTLELYECPHLTKKHIDTFMKTCPEKFMQNFKKFRHGMDVAAFAKKLKKNEIQHFILKQCEDKDVKPWFDYNNLKHFIKHMPEESRFEFVRNTFMENGKDSPYQPPQALRCQSSYKRRGNSNNNDALYRWYKFAPFSIAYPELKKLIRIESSPAERNSMLTILVTCAGKNTKNIKELVHYYHEKHINESFKFKVHFVNNLISKTNTHAYDDETWKLLEDLFRSLEVYCESEHKVQACVRTIIIYKVIREEKIPEIIEKKFEFDTLRAMQAKLDKDGKQRLFSYLYSYLLAKLQKYGTIHNEYELSESISSVEKLQRLLLDWNRDIKDFPMLIIKIKDIMKVKKKHQWSMSLDNFYNKKKSWRKYFFEESLILHPDVDACVNALKHDPTLLSRYQGDIEILRFSDVPLQRLLRKLRIYWPQTLAAEWICSYLRKLEKTGGTKAIISGLFTLMAPKQYNELVNKNVPTETKVNWNEEHNEKQFSVAKNIAKYLYMTRPQPSPDVILAYAKGDFLQYALPSLTSIFYSLNSTESRIHVPKLLNSPVSLQKHGIRFAFHKLNTNELKEIFQDTWLSSKNPSIRTILFQSTFNLLCQQKNPLVIDELWDLLSMFIDNLTTEENVAIYNTLGKIYKIPISIRPQVIMKNYAFLKTLPPKLNAAKIINEIVRAMQTIVELMDPEFLAELLLESVLKSYVTEMNKDLDIISAYVLSAKDETSQIERYERVVVPMMDMTFLSWYLKGEDQIYYARENLFQFLDHIGRDVRMYIAEKKSNIPVKVFEKIVEKFETVPQLESNYILVTSWKLACEFVKVLDKHKDAISDIEIEKDDSNQWTKNTFKQCNDYFIQTAPDYAKMCLVMLQKDIERLFPSIYSIFATSLQEMFMMFGIDDFVQFHIYYELLSPEKPTECHLVVTQLIRLDMCNLDEECQKIGNDLIAKLKSHETPEVRIHYRGRADKRRTMYC